MIKGHANGLWRDTLPRYCCRCGAELERAEDGTTYDSRTGKPIHHDFTLACPNGDGHVLVTRNPHGNLYSLTYY